LLGFSLGSLCSGEGGLTPLAPSLTALGLSEESLILLDPSL
jgi:hypothetical protein